MKRLEPQPFAGKMAGPRRATAPAPGSQSWASTKGPFTHV